MIFESLLFKFQLNYAWYTDLDTVEKRVLQVTRMMLSPKKITYAPLPKLIVHIDLKEKTSDGEKSMYEE